MDFSVTLNDSDVIDSVDAADAFEIVRCNEGAGNEIGFSGKGFSGKEFSGCSGFSGTVCIFSSFFKCFYIQLRLCDSFRHK